MENFLLGFCVGFGGATVVALFWFRGQGKEWLDKKSNKRLINSAANNV